MDDLARKDRDFECDLESGGRASESDLDRDSPLSDKVYGGYADGSNKGENGIVVHGNASNCNVAFVEKFEVVIDKKVDGARNLGSAEKKTQKEKRKSTSNKKPPKPPRPPMGPSLDSADQKLVKEIAELAMMKRARNERMKAIKKMKASKASSSSGNVIAMIFTALFCLVIIFQGVSSRSPASSFQGSPLSAAPTDGGLISVQYFPNPSVSTPNGPGSDSPTLVEQVTDSAPTQEHGGNFS